MRFFSHTINCRHTNKSNSDFIAHKCFCIQIYENIGHHWYFLRKFNCQSGYFNFLAPAEPTNGWLRSCYLLLRFFGSYRGNNPNFFLYEIIAIYEVVNIDPELVICDSGLIGWMHSCRLVEWSIIRYIVHRYKYTTKVGSALTLNYFTILILLNGWYTIQIYPLSTDLALVCSYVWYVEDVWCRRFFRDICYEKILTTAYLWPQTNCDLVVVTRLITGEVEASVEIWSRIFFECTCSLY